MHFVFYPKHEYGCPHVSHCPHLGGAALGTLVEVADEQDRMDRFALAANRCAAGREHGQVPEDRGFVGRNWTTATRVEKAKTLQGRIRRYTAEWLTFLEHPGVPPTNNLAEQAVRFLVVLRKVTFGSRTRAGARRLGAMLTVIQTAKRQGKNVIRFLVALCTLTPNQAVRAMYARP